MRCYQELAVPVFENTIDKWGAYKSQFLFVPAIKQLLLEIMTKVFLGIDDVHSAEAKRITQLVNAIHEKGLMSLFKFNIPGFKFHKGVKAKRELYEYLICQIPLRRGGNGSDIFSMLCKEKTEQGHYYSNIDIANHMNFLLFASHDSTVSLLSHTFMYLIRPEYHHIQQMLYQESIKKNNKMTDNQPVEYNQVAKWVLLESLRLHPSVSILARRTIRGCVLGNYRIPANTMLYLTPYWAQSSTEFWDNPEKFDPERFSSVRAENKRHPFQFIGFGGGVHKCVGMKFAEIISKLFLYQFFSKYKVKPIDNNYITPTQIMPIPKPADDLPIIVEPV